MIIMAKQLPNYELTREKPYIIINNILLSPNYEQASAKFS